MKYSLVLIILAVTALSTQVLYRPDIQKGHIAPKDSVFLANPIQDRIMLFNEKKDIIVNNVFSRFPNNVDWFPAIEKPLVVVANLEQNAPQYDLVLKLEANEIEGESDVSYTAYYYTDYAYIDSLQTDSVQTDSITMTDTFNVRVFDPDCEWLSAGTTFGFEPENCVGSMTVEWKSAAVFDLGLKTYTPKAIEFGYLYDGKVKCEIVPFGTVPEDSVLILVSDSLTVEGGVAKFNYDGLSGELTGKIAVVFTTEYNFMPMDPSGDSDNAWVWTEWTGWTRPELISPDYQGAWYIKLLAKEIPTGITEEFVSSKSCGLMKNYPNPFNGETVISWSMVSPGNARINIYNSKGELVKSLGEKSYGSGYHFIRYNSSGLNSGVFYYELEIDGKKEASGKMLYLK